MKETQVMFAEDNDDHAELIMESFDDQNEKYRLTRSRNGQQLLNDLKKRLNNHIDLPDVVLLDIKMPSIDGIKALQRIKADKRLKTLPVIMLTTSDRDKDIEQCFKYGADGYLVKPFSYHEFYHILKKNQSNKSDHI